MAHTAKLPANFGKVMDSPVPFGDRLSALCAIELTIAKNDAGRGAEMIERLVNSLAFTIAIIARGDPKIIDNMLTGAVSHLYEMGTTHAKVGALLEILRRP